MTAAGPTAARRRAWRIIPEIDKDPRLIDAVQRVPGRLVLFAVFALVSHALAGNLLIVLCAAVVAYSGRYRWHVLPFATLLLAYWYGFFVDVNLIRRVADQEGLAGRIHLPVLTAGMFALVVILCAVLLRAWPRIRAIRLFRRPTLSLVVGFLGLVLVAQPPVTSGWVRIFLWAFLSALLPYLWFLAYALHDVEARRDQPLLAQRLGVFHPFWGPSPMPSWAASPTPFGKGLSYLRRFESLTAQDLAVTQLKGLKLAVWAGLLVVFWRGFLVVAYGSLDIPQFDDAFSQFLVGDAPSRLLCWASLVASFVDDLLSVTTWGAMIVALARMAGFRLLRNTYRPLEAKTLAEFWNRYYFYYKELMVDHFFYPTFLLCFKKHRRLRVFFATFVAACVGNLLFHFIRDIRFVVDMGFWRAAIGDQSHALYTFLLALGVGLSQMLHRKRADSPGLLRGTVLPCLWVVGFFCILHVFDAPLDREHTVWQRAQFLFYLFGAG